MEHNPDRFRDKMKFFREYHESEHCIVLAWFEFKLEATTGIWFCHFHADRVPSDDQKFLTFAACIAYITTKSQEWETEVSRQRFREKNNA